MAQRARTDGAVETEASLRSLVRESALPVALFDPSARRILDVSAPVRERLESIGVDFATTDLLDLAGEAEIAGRVLALIRDGHLERWNSRHWLKGPGGRRIDYFATGRALSVEGARILGLVYFDPVPQPNGSQPDDDAGSASATIRPSTLLDADLFGIVHPDDLEQLGNAVAQALSGRRVVSAGFRVRGSGPGWCTLRVDLRPDDVEAPDAMPGGAETAREIHRAMERLAALERHLWAIAREVVDAGVIPERPVLRDPEMDDLTSRQLEIVSRLVQGERVPTIARSMFLSQKTVRTHLANVFRKFGVHSQAELLERIRKT